MNFISQCHRSKVKIQTYGVEFWNEGHVQEYLGQVQRSIVEIRTVHVHVDIWKIFLKRAVLDLTLCKDSRTLLGPENLLDLHIIGYDGTDN